MAGGANGNGGSATEERLIELIASKLRALGRSHRWLERKLRLGHGTVTNLLARRTSIRFEHLERVAGLLGTTPAALVAEAEGNGSPMDLVKLRLVLDHLAAALRAAEEATGTEEVI